MGCACNRVLWFWFQVSVSERGLIMVSFSYKYTPIDQLAVDTVVNDKTGKKIVRSVTFDGVEHRPSERFWMSLFSRYSFNSQFFRYFDHHEVFDRIVQVQGKDDIRLCMGVRMRSHTMVGLLRVCILLVCSSPSLLVGICSTIGSRWLRRLMVTVFRRLF